MIKVLGKLHQRDPYRLSGAAKCNNAHTDTFERNGGLRRTWRGHRALPLIVPIGVHTLVEHNHHRTVKEISSSCDPTFLKVVEVGFRILKGFRHCFGAPQMRERP